MRKVPRIRDAAPLPDARSPRISILFAARDEEEKLPEALASLLAQDYPDFEVVAVNDRSRDRTPEILEDFARRHTKLTVVHVRELPPGWLGKPYGLQQSYENSSGEWLIFTDADVCFAPDLLRRAMATILVKQWDHMALLGWLELRGFWETLVILYFGLGLIMRFPPWRVPDPRSKVFFGAGYFQLVRRSAYEGSGTHRRLAMEVIDDMKLGKIIKQAGYRSGAALAEKSVTLRWQHGLGSIIRGVTKNFFAGANFRVPTAILHVSLVLVFSVLPFAALFWTSGWALLFAAASVGTAAAIEATAALWTGYFPLYGLTHPLGALIFAYMILRSTVVTLWRGGIVWRDTFYPLDELKRGLV